MADIEIFIEGIMVLLFEKDASGNKTACVVGVVNGVPKHNLEIKCKKNGTTDIPINPATVTQLKLEVENTTKTGIRFFSKELINRVTGAGSPQSSSWILDFEDELYQREIGVDPSKFKPIFRINNGEIFTDKISVNHLLTRNEADPSEPFTLVGRVATRVGLRTNLDLANSKARLFDGTTLIAEVGHGEKLEMSVALICPSCSHTGQQTGHANHYYRAIGQKLMFGERLLFSSTKMPDLGITGPISPEASCLTGSAGTSNPNG